MAFVKTTIAKEDQDEDEYFISTGEREDLLICKSPDKLRRLIRALEPGKSLHYVSDGDWSMHDLVIELLRTYKPAELFFSTYAIRELPIRQLILAMDRKELLSVNMLLDYRAKARTPEVFQLASLNANKIYLTSIHAKVTVIRSDHGCVSIVGSPNWTQNPRVECGVISLNAELAKFHINWMEKIMDNAEIFS